MNPLNPLSAQSRFELKIFELLYITLDCGNDDCCYGGFALLLVKHLRHSNNNTRPVWSEKRCDPFIMFVAQLFGCSLDAWKQRIIDRLRRTYEKMAESVPTTQHSTWYAITH